MADDDGPNNLIHFPRVGYTEPADTPPETPDPAPVDVPFAAPSDASDDAPEPFALATRPSPLDTLTALADPGLGAPFAGNSEPETASAPAAQTVPATFRPETAQPAAPRLGALSLAAILAVSVAAMRGIHSAVAGRQASKEQQDAVARTASTGKDSPGSGARKQVQPSHEWGRRSLQSGPGGRAGRSGGFGLGRSSRGAGGSYGGLGSGRRNAPATRSPSRSGGLFGGGRGGRGGGSGPGGRGPGIHSPRRSSQSGGPGLKRNSPSRGPGSSGSGGSGGAGRARKGPGASGGGLKRRGPGGSGPGLAGAGGSILNRKRGPGGTVSGGSAGGPGAKRGPGGKSPVKGPGTGAGIGAAGAKGSGTGTTVTGPKRGWTKSPRGTTGLPGILRKKPGTTTSGTGPKSKGPGSSGPGGSGTPATGKGGATKGRKTPGKGGGTGPVGPVPKAPGGKSRKGKKVTLTPGIAHGTFAATDKYGCRCGKCRRFKREYDKKVIGAMRSAARGRTTLGEAIHETAQKRLKRRRKKLSPVMTKVKVKKPKKKSGSKTTAAAGTKPAGPTATRPAGPAATAPARGGSWNTAKARARKRARMWARPVPAPVPAPAPAGAATVPPGPSKPTAPPVTVPAAVTAAGATTAAIAPGTGTVPGTGVPRVSPFEAMGMATAVPDPAGPITVERADSPHPAPAKPAAGLPAGTSTKESSVSTVPDLTRDNWLAMWGDGGIAGMAAEHQTEVTLDDTLDVLEELTEQSFKAHETCKKLSAKARQIRYDLEELAADLRSRHNVIGRLTGAAMARLAESMELLARKADEMSVKSLQAAELCETAENAMFDAYRPVQQATEDAGLAVPSARIHNEG